MKRLIIIKLGCLVAIFICLSGFSTSSANNDIASHSSSNNSKIQRQEVPSDLVEQVELLRSGETEDDDSVTKNHDLTFYHALIASLSVIIVSELGDKTWFIAAIMAMKHSRLTVYFGAMAALILMTLLSVGMGWLTQVIPRFITYYISTALFAIFGLKMLHEGYKMSPSDSQEEYEEAKAEVQKEDLFLESPKIADMESGLKHSSTGSTCAVLSFVSNLFLKAFTLTFLAEWGDRSQLTTIVLAARENVYGVILGGVAGHALCTGIAVIGGKLVATQISVRTVTLIGGVVFILFALSAFFVNPE